MRNSLILALAFFLLTPLVSGQTVGRAAQFDSAKEAFENGEYQQAIDLLAVYERSFGTSPRLESLRAMAYRDLNMPREAFRTLLVYFKLTANKDLTSNQTHQELIGLRDSLSAGFDKERDEKLRKLERERDREADRIVSKAAASDTTRMSAASTNIASAEQ